MVTDQKIRLSKRLSVQLKPIFRINTFFRTFPTAHTSIIRLVMSKISIKQ